MSERWHLMYEDDNEVGVLQLGEQDVEVHFDSRVDAENGMHYLNSALDALAEAQATLAKFVTLSRIIVDETDYEPHDQSANLRDAIWGCGGLFDLLASTEKGDDAS